MALPSSRQAMAAVATTAATIKINRRKDDFTRPSFLQYRLEFDLYRPPCSAQDAYTPVMDIRRGPIES
jgi:hypothetical protein